MSSLLPVVFLFSVIIHSFLIQGEKTLTGEGSGDDLSRVFLKYSEAVSQV